MSEHGGTPPQPPDSPHRSPYESPYGSAYAGPPLPPAGAPPAPPEDQQAPRSDQVPGWVLGVAGLVVLALAGLLVFVVVHGSDEKPSAAPPGTEQRFPKHWDRRIAPYAKIAARERGLDYQHPVAVRFLAPGAFKKALRAESGTQTAQDRQEAEHTTAILRALGLVSGHPDLLAATRSFGDSQVLAYYSFTTKSITVRGTTITTAMKSTLVHELTHVLQDQNYDVGDELKRLQKREKQTHQGETAEVLDAVVEGDAVRVEGLYRDSLPPAQRRALDAAQARQARASNHQLAKVPRVISTMLTSPYTLGLGLARTAEDDGGNDAVDKLLQFPPDHTSTLLDPLRAITSSAGDAHVAPTALKPGEKEFDSGEFGALTWYLTLASNLPAEQALAAADGWAGDSYAGFTRGGDTCARMTFAGTNAAADARMLHALEQWARAARGASAHAQSVGGHVVFESCDPGTRVKAGNDSPDKAVQLVVARTQLTDTFLENGLGIPASRCLSNKLIQEFTLAQLTDPTFGANDPNVTTRVQQLAIGCQSA